MSSEIGENDYRLGGQERLREAKALLDEELLCGAAYLAGRAVESLLRALIWRFDAEIRSGSKSLDTGHDLRDLLREVVDLGVLTDQADRDELFENVQYVGRLWFNNMRFVPAKKLKALWWRQGEIGRKRELKRAVKEYYDSCAWIVERCEGLCKE